VGDLIMTLESPGEAYTEKRIAHGTGPKSAGLSERFRQCEAVMQGATFSCELDDLANLRPLEARSSQPRLRLL